VVADPATAEALKPWYRQLCKRPCFHDEYLATFNLPSVHLVDTDGRGVDSIDAEGVWVGETHFDLDCLIFATGFEVGTSYARRSGFEVVGRDGLTLSEAWEDGMESLHGIHVHGFPNLFVLGINQGANLISNVPHNLVEAARTISAVVAHAQKTGATSVEVTTEAQQAWVENLLSAGPTIFGGEQCTPGYYNNEGGPIGRKQRLFGSGYAAGPIAYFNYIDAWRNSGRFQGLEFR
jgi:cation diffusion facilitator CzcD-associated flavoprotein CzcO